MQGGISNGETIYFKVAFKPTATIGVSHSGAENFLSESQNRENVIERVAMFHGMLFE